MRYWKILHRRIKLQFNHTSESKVGSKLVFYSLPIVLLIEFPLKTYLKILYKMYPDASLILLYSVTKEPDKKSNINIQIHKFDDISV